MVKMLSVIHKVKAPLDKIAKTLIGLSINWQVGCPCSGPGQVSCLRALHRTYNKGR
jgi:hypothetical protein